MKAITTQLRDHLASGGPFVMTDLYTIYLSSGAVLRWADFDVDVAHPGDGQVYLSSGPALKRGRTRVVIGLEVDTLDVSIYPRSTDEINGVPLLAAARVGVFDGATLSLERAFLDTDSLEAVGVVSLFVGRFADLQLSRTEIQARINSAAEALAIQMPRNIYQPGCGHTLYDVGCGLSRAAFGVSSQADAGSTSSVLECDLVNDAGWFDRGYIQFTGGVFDGVRKTIKRYSPGVITLFSPLPAAPDVGAVFIAYPGCNKSMDTCRDKFGNLPAFRGMPFIPVPETAV